MMMIVASFVCVFVSAQFDFVGARVTYPAAIVVRLAESGPPAMNEGGTQKAEYSPTRNPASPLQLILFGKSPPVCCTKTYDLFQRP